MFRVNKLRRLSIPYIQPGRRRRTTADLPKPFLVVFILAALSWPGCEGSDKSTNADVNDSQTDTTEQTPGDTKSIILSFEGIYQLQTFTENPAGCDEEGPSTFETKMERQFVLVASDYGKSTIPSFLWLASCTDDADCMTLVDWLRAGGSIYNTDEEESEYENAFGAVVGLDELQERTGALGGIENELCSGRYVIVSRLLREGDGVRIETRRTDLNDAPPESGLCYWEGGLDALLAEAETMPCSALTVFTGIKLAALP